METDENRILADKGSLKNWVILSLKGHFEVTLPQRCKINS